MFNLDSPYAEPGFDAWKQGLEALPPSEVLFRNAEQTAQDGRWMRWMQADCESTNIHSAEDNASKIGQQHVCSQRSLLILWAFVVCTRVEPIRTRCSFN